VTVEYTIKAKEVEWSGYRFKSRLEATWAVFFEKIGWDWEYEPCAFDGWIPDFKISTYDERINVFIEVKPISELDKDVAAKINSTTPSDSPGDPEITDSVGDVFVIIGNGPLEKPNFASVPFFGWMRERGDWGIVPFGMWTGSESDHKNTGNVIGFCSSDMSYYDVITGCYDGGCWGEGKLPDVFGIWSESKNEVSRIIKENTEDAGLAGARTLEEIGPRLDSIEKQLAEIKALLTKELPCPTK
jgi:hypothetical protein